MPIYQSTSFVFEDTADAADLFALQKFGTIYTRISNPTTAVFEERIACLEGGIGAVATSSGMAAEFLTVTALAGAGDHVVASARLYGGTLTQFDVTLRRLGIDTTFVAATGPRRTRPPSARRRRPLHGDIGNPKGNVADLGALAEIAHDAGIPLVVDATFATPFLCRPIEHGADIVIHSATKFLGGHGTSIGGVMVESGRFDWGVGKFPLMTAPVAVYNGLSWWDNFAEYAFCTRFRSEQLRDVGATLSPFNAFLLLQGVETLPQRMTEHVANAQAVAEWLEQHAAVSWVSYAGLASSPYHDLAKRYLPAGPGAMFTFGVRAGARRASASSRRCSWSATSPTSATRRTLVIHPGRPPTSSSTRRRSSGRA